MYLSNVNVLRIYFLLRIGLIMEYKFTSEFPIAMIIPIFLIYFQLEFNNVLDGITSYAF